MPVHNICSNGLFKAEGIVLTLSNRACMVLTHEKWLFSLFPCSNLASSHSLLKHIKPSRKALKQYVPYLLICQDKEKSLWNSGKSESWGPAKVWESNRLFSVENVIDVWNLWLLKNHIEKLRCSVIILRIIRMGKHICGVWKITLWLVLQTKKRKSVLLVYTIILLLVGLSNHFLEFFRHCTKLY